jgi:hypothetical protein
MGARGWKGRKGVGKSMKIFKINFYYYFLAIFVQSFGQLL